MLVLISGISQWPHGTLVGARCSLASPIAAKVSISIGVPLHCMIVRMCMLDLFPWNEGRANRQWSGPVEITSAPVDFNVVNREHHAWRICGCQRPTELSGGPRGFYWKAIRWHVASPASLARVNSMYLRGSEVPAASEPVFTRQTLDFP